MKGLLAVLVYAALASVQVSHCNYRSEVVLCTDICPSSPLVAPNGTGVMRCYDACKRLIHRVKYGDVMDSKNMDDKVKAPKKPFRRLRNSIGNAWKNKRQRPTASS